MGPATETGSHLPSSSVPGHWDRTGLGQPCHEKFDSVSSQLLHRPGPSPTAGSDTLMLSVQAGQLRCASWSRVKPCDPFAESHAVSVVKGVFLCPQTRVQVWLGPHPPSPFEGTCLLQLHAGGVTRQKSVGVLGPQG